MNNSTGWLKWGFVGPTLIFLVGLNIFPLIYNIVLSFSNADLVSGEWDWVGGKNYGRIFGDAEFAGAIRNTAYFVFLAVSIELLLGFAVALALHRKFKGKTTLLIVLLVPMMLSPAVMGLYWNLLFNGNYGIINQVLSALGWENPPQWLTDKDMKFYSIVLVDVWMWTPFMILIAMAGLQSIPKHLYEAMEVDRAGMWTVFTRLTLPLCSPLLLLAVLLRTTDALKQFDLVMAMTGPNDEVTQTLSALMYQIVFRSGKVGLGSSYAIVILVMVIAIATLFTRYLDRLKSGSSEN